LVARKTGRQRQGPDETIMTTKAMRRFSNGAFCPATRDVADEIAIALVYDGATHAVMMATPQDLEDFAIGFSLSEGVITCLADIRELEVVSHDGGIELRIWLQPGASRPAHDRRRLITGPTGCGLCGVDSLEAACRPARKVAVPAAISAHDVFAAIAGLGTGQKHGKVTRAMHAASFHDPQSGTLTVREDVGRHNALDKLIGHMARQNRSAAGGIVAITSRVSIEMVQKAAVLGAGYLVAVSAPTSLAIATAEAAGITLVAVARYDGFEVYSHPDRIQP
jgi:FdhD protein